MRFLSAEDTNRLLDWESTIACIREAYGRELEDGAVPGRVIARAKPAFIRCMPAAPPSGRYMGTKQIVRGRDDHVSYLITLFHQRNASLDFLIDGLIITSKRTAATSAVAVALLAPKRPLRLGVLGSGLEARSHVEAIAQVRPIESLRVFSPTPANRSEFAMHYATALNCSSEAMDSAEAAIADANLIVTAARSRGERPILFARDLKPGTTIVSIGSTIPTQRELDVSVIERADIIVADEPRELIEEAGDMIEAKKAGLRFESKMYSLRQLVRGELTALLHRKEQIVLFKSLGSALQDISVAELVATRALVQGLGISLPIALADKVAEKRSSP